MMYEGKWNFRSREIAGQEEPSSFLLPRSLIFLSARNYKQQMFCILFHGYYISFTCQLIWQPEFITDEKHISLFHCLLLHV